MSTFQINEKNTFFLQGQGDAGLAIVAILNVSPTVKVNVVVAHMGSEPSDLQNQTVSIISIIASLSGPTILMGTMNCFPNSTYISSILHQTQLSDAYADAHGGHHISTSPFGPVDYIFYTDLVLINASIVETTASNHFPLQATFSIQT